MYYKIMTAIFILCNEMTKQRMMIILKGNKFNL